MLGCFLSICTLPREVNEETITDKSLTVDAASVICGLAQQLLMLQNSLLLLDGGTDVTPVRQGGDELEEAKRKGQEKKKNRCRDVQTDSSHELSMAGSGTQAVSSLLAGVLTSPNHRKCQLYWTKWPLLESFLESGLESTRWDECLHRTSDFYVNNFSIVGGENSGSSFTTPQAVTPITLFFTPFSPVLHIHLVA